MALIGASIENASVGLITARNLLHGGFAGPVWLVNPKYREIEGRDIARAPPPLDLNLAHDLMRQTRVWRLLQGYRDRPPAAIGAIALVLVRLGYLVARHPEIRELDINTLFADAGGVIALDARVKAEDPVRRPRVPMAIRPYPSEWETEAQIAPVGTVRIRPIRPQDEALYAAFFAR